MMNSYTTIKLCPSCSAPKSAHFVTPSIYFDDECFPYRGKGVTEYNVAGGHFPLKQKGICLYYDDPINWRSSPNV